MKNRAKIIAVIVLCGVTMLMLLIHPYKNLNAESNITDKSGAKIAYQSKGKKMLDAKRANREKQNAGKKSSVRGKTPDADRDKASKGDAGFYRAVVENNLFRPLGWQRPNREPQYTLIATLIESEGTAAKALMMERRSNQFYYVAVGEKVGQAIVKKIELNEVTLDKAGGTMTIRAESSQFLSSSGGEGSGSASADGDNRRNRNAGKRESRDGKQSGSDQKANRSPNRSRQELLRKWADRLRGWVESGKLSEADARAKYEWAEKGSDADVKAAVGGDKDDNDRGK